jgi:hypothetical protein
MINNVDDLINKINDMNVRVESKTPRRDVDFVSSGGGAGMMKSRSNYFWAGWSVPPSSKGG